MCPGFSARGGSGCSGWRLPAAPSLFICSLSSFSVRPAGGLGLALERALPGIVCPAPGGPWLCQPGPVAAPCAKGSARRHHSLTLLIRSAAPVNWKWMREVGGGGTGELFEASPT